MKLSDEMLVKIRDYHMVQSSTDSLHLSVMAEELLQLREQLRIAVDGIKKISKAPTWGAIMTDGSRTSHTYKSYTVGIARETLAKLEDMEGKK